MRHASPKVGVEQWEKIARLLELGSDGGNIILLARVFQKKRSDY
jgi:hypothetical protein